MSFGIADRVETETFIHGLKKLNYIMNLNRFGFLIIIVICCNTNIRSQFNVGHYERTDSKVYFVSELGTGIGYLKETKVEGTVANPNGFSRGEYVFNVYSNQGVMFNINSDWSCGLHGNIGLNLGDITEGSWLGLRTRISRHFGHGIEWNISPGIRTKHLGELSGYDLESTISWRDHIGIYTRYEREFHDEFNFYDRTEIFSVGLFTKGKKGFWSSVGTATGGIAFTAIVLSLLLGR